MVFRIGFSRRGALLGVLACSAAVALALPATAAAKVTSLTSCQTISSAGKYRLDADVTAGAGDCYDIHASGVTLVLNGHTITSPLGGQGILVAGSGARIVGPGTVSGFLVGILLLSGGNGSVRGVTATGDGDGIALGSANNSVRGNVATDNGIGIGAFAPATGNTIIGNSAHANSFDDLFDNNANCDSNVWRGNDFGSANQSCIH
jgi:parallel beta-helix repeat protein